MGRRNRRRDGSSPVRPLTVVGERRESWRGEAYSVRSVAGQGATKVYRCPGCDHEIQVGLPHVVAWPEHDIGGSERRHWHTRCWEARETRRPSR